MDEKKFDGKYWDERYIDHTTAWDIGKISPPLKEYIDQLKNKSIRVLIPGCGNAYEAEYLLEDGFTNITLVDISPTLVKSIQQKLKAYDGKQLRIICADFFDLNQEFDLIFEQTFFCALDPSLRISYVNKMHDLLKPTGKLIGVLFNRSFDGGPPFSGSKEEYEKLFSEKFEIKKMETCYNSIPQRQGTELFVIFSGK
ncbi:MAG: methyltransferase domain-containing protein [Ferruginibacter sp.]